MAYKQPANQPVESSQVFVKLDDGLLQSIQQHGSIGSQPAGQPAAVAIPQTFAQPGNTACWQPVTVPAITNRPQAVASLAKSPWGESKVMVPIELEAEHIGFGGVMAPQPAHVALNSVNRQPQPWKPMAPPSVAAPLVLPPPPAAIPDPELLKFGALVKGPLETLSKRCRTACASNPLNQRKLDDIDLKLSKLFVSIEQGTVTQVVLTNMKIACDQANNAEYANASKLVHTMAKDHFAEINCWGPSATRLFKLCQQFDPRTQTSNH